MTDDLTTRLAALSEKGVELPDTKRWRKHSSLAHIPESASCLAVHELLTIIEQQQEELEAAYFMARGWREKFRKADRAKREAVDGLKREERSYRTWRLETMRALRMCDSSPDVIAVVAKHCRENLDAAAAALEHERRKRCATCELEHPDLIDGWHDAGCAMRIAAGYGRFCSGFGCSEWRPRDDGLDSNEHPSFWINDECPMHGHMKKEATP